jgi:hypothetical protein
MVSTRRGAGLRRSILLLSAGFFLVGAYWIGRSFVVNGRLRFGNPVADDARLLSGNDFAPLQVRAEIVSARGKCGVSLGDKCEFLVERRARAEGSFYCNAQIVCGGRLLYGGPDRGYFACRLFEGGSRREVMGSDPSTTAADQDAALHLDTRAGVLRIWDDDRGSLGAFDVEADVLSVQ